MATTRTETRLRCRRCEIPYVVLGHYPRRPFRCRYCGTRLVVTRVGRRARRR
jgi:ribosomal protein S27E